MGRNPECKLPECKVNDDSYQRGYDAAVKNLSKSRELYMEIGGEGFRCWGASIKLDDLETIQTLHGDEYLKTTLFNMFLEIKGASDKIPHYE